MRIVDEQDNGLATKRTGPQIIIEEVELYICCVFIAVQGEVIAERRDELSKGLRKMVKKDHRNGFIESRGEEGEQRCFPCS
jgi:hypothetical protein